jgi:hypothetical protein
LVSGAAGQVPNQAKPGWSQVGLLTTKQLETNFIDFGNDVKDLAENLDNIKDVVQNASTTWDTRFKTKPIWNLSSLSTIIGNCAQTLKSCDTLLKEERKFNRGGSFIYNVEWNVRVQPQIDLLRQRLTFHTAKVCLEIFRYTSFI